MNIRFSLPSTRLARFVAYSLAMVWLTACFANRSSSSQFPNLLWTYDAKDTTVQFSVPTVTNGVVYLAGQASIEGHSGRLVALDEATGAVRWDVAYENLTLLPPVVKDKTLLAIERSGGQRTLLVIDANNGQLLWRGPDLRGRPLFTKTLIWLIGNDNQLLALAPADGKIVFKRHVSSDTAGALVESAGILYVGDPDGVLFALNASDGTELWQTEAEPRGYYNAPLVANGLVYLDAPLKAYDAKTGEVRWVAERLTDGFTPILFGDTLYVRGFPDNETIHALDAATGTERWSFNAVGSLTLQGTDWLAVQDSTLFVLAENDVYALDIATGAVRWQYTLPRYPSSDCLVEFSDGPVLLDGVIYLNSKSETLGNSCFSEFTSQIRLDAANGTLLGETKIDKPFFSDPEILFGLIAVHDRLFQNASGKLYVMQSPQ